MLLFFRLKSLHLKNYSKFHLDSETMGLPAIRSAASILIRSGMYNSRSFGYLRFYVISISGGWVLKRLVVFSKANAQSAMTHLRRWHNGFVAPHGAAG
jgi:hypothetical protein